jgi:hypothetical protein
MTQAAAQFHPDRTAAKKKPGLQWRPGFPVFATLGLGGQPRVRERIMKLS